MAKFLLRIEAREMRSSGKSVKKIARKLHVSKSTVSLWTRDIPLSPSQVKKLKQNALKGAELGRLKSALIKKKKRLELISHSKQSGIFKLANLTDRELLIAGLCLYWGEGTKKTPEVKICNSDPELIKFIIKWLIRVFRIKKAEIFACVGINEIHKQREKTVKKYWSKVTGIPLDQFRKTSFKKIKNKKVYKNFNSHYGTLTVGILRCTRFYYKIIGLIEGLKYNFLAV